MKTLSVDLIRLELKKKVPRFARGIQPAYRELDFKWGRYPSQIDSTPTVKEIEDALYELIELVEEVDLSLPHPYMARASGGLSVGYSIEKDYDDDFITSMEIFITFNYDDTSYEDIENYLQEWE